MDGGPETADAQSRAAEKGEEVFRLPPYCDRDLQEWLAKNASEPVFFSWSKGRRSNLSSDTVKAMRDHARLHNQPWNWNGAFCATYRGSEAVAGWAVEEGHLFEADWMMTECFFGDHAEDPLLLTRLLFRLCASRQELFTEANMSFSLAFALRLLLDSDVHPDGGVTANRADALEMCTLFVDYARARRVECFDVSPAVRALNDDSLHCDHVEARRVLRTHARCVLGPDVEYDLMPCADVWSIAWTYAI